MPNGFPSENEGVRRLAIVAGIIAGPIWFIIELAERRYNWPSSSETPMVFSIVVVISALVWLGIHTVAWVLSGFFGSGSNK